MSAMASQITEMLIVWSTMYLCAHQRKHQSSASLAFVREIHLRPVDSPHKGPVTQTTFPIDDVGDVRFHQIGSIKQCGSGPPNATSLLISCRLEAAATGDATPFLKALAMIFTCSWTILVRSSNGMCPSKEATRQSVMELYMAAHLINSSGQQCLRWQCTDSPSDWLLWLILGMVA